MQCAKGCGSEIELWRGMKNVEVKEEFMQERHGGTEVAPMSTTTSLRVALEYCAGPRPLLFRVKPTSFFSSGAQLAFLSCFPEEAETLFPPLTYLRPTTDTPHEVIIHVIIRHKREKIKICIIDVVPELS